MTAGLPTAVLADSDTGKGSPIGLFVVLLLIVAVYFLYRSMSGHLRRLPERFPGPDQAAGTGDEAELEPSADEHSAAEPSPTDTSQAGLSPAEQPPAEPPSIGPSGR